LVEGIFTGLAIVAALSSAWLWVQASLVPIPPVNWDGEGSFYDALKRQSKLNAHAAMCAAGAAALQSVALLAHMFGR
jgi:hypothetical protein